MESTRQLKIAKLIQKELGDIFQRDGKAIFGNVFITITKATITPDLSIAKIYLSFLLVDNKKELLDMVSSETKTIRKLLGERIRKQVRIIPELQFYIDENLDYAAKMDDIFAKLNIPPAPPEQEEDEPEDE